MITCEGLIYAGSAHGYVRCGRGPVNATRVSAHSPPKMLCSDCRKRYTTKQDTCPTCHGSGRAEARDG